MIDAEETSRRALTALRALAVGDAIGAATEGYRPDEILEVYGEPITGLTEPVNLYPERDPDRGRARIGPVTEAALEAVALLRGLGPRVSPAAVGWSVSLGIARPVSTLDELVEWGNGSTGYTAAAAAVAAAIAAGVGGFMARDALALAVRAAQLGSAPDLASAIVRAAGAAQASGGRQVGSAVAQVIAPGPDVEAAVVFAFGVAFGAQSVRRAVLQAANEGGTASLTAGLAGALCGVVAPRSLVESWADEVEAVNGLDLRAAAEQLLLLRSRADASAPRHGGRSGA